MCGSSIASLDAGSAKSNGIIQIIASSILIVLTVTGGFYVLFFSISGVSFLLGGVVMLLAGIRRHIGSSSGSSSISWMVAALVFAVINVLLSLFVLLTELVEFFRFAFTSYFRSTSVLLIFISTMFVVYALSFALIWAVVIASRALHYRANARAEVHRNVQAGSTCLKANWIAQAVMTGVTVVFATVSSVFAFEGNDSSKGMILACTLSDLPVYLINIYLGFRSSRFGENSSLISFLVVNIIQLPLSMWQLSVWVMTMHFFGDISNYVLIICAVVHFCFSIWGIATSSAAIHHDGTCGGCCSVGAENGNAGRNAIQPYMVAMVAPPGANRAAPRMILIPVSAGQMPTNAGQMPIYAGQMPMNAGQMPIYAEQMPMNAGQIPIQTGQLQPGLHNISNISLPPSYDNHAYSVMNAELTPNPTGQIQTGIQNIATDSPPPSYDNHAYSAMIE